MRFWKQWFLGWVPLAAYSSFIFHSALLPPEAIPAWLAMIPDKVAHATEYFILFFFAAQAFSKSRVRGLQASWIFWSFVYCLLLGFMTEYAQRYAPGRYADFWDWVADGVGAAIALGMVGMVRWIRRKKTEG